MTPDAAPVRMSIAMALAALAMAGCAGRGRFATVEAVAYPEAERLFRQDPRWLGGDAAYSISLTKDRSVWLFGDSFIATGNEKNRRSAKFVRNTIAIQSGADPGTASMRFFWKESGSREPASFFEEGDDFWYWPAGGARAADGTLLIFLHKVEVRDGGLGFAIAGYSIAKVANPDAPPDQWRVELHDALSPGFDAVPACAMPGEDGGVLAIAVRQSGIHAGMLMRYGADDIASGSFAFPEWWTGDEAGWVSARGLGTNRPSIVIDDAGAECSLHFDRPAGVFVHVASYGFGASDIGMRTSISATGPWSDPALVYHPPESDAVQPFVYAGKAHPELGKPNKNELLITYAANSFEPKDLLTLQGEASLYWPRVVRVRLKR